jgi:hydroxymethylglutaryl-CoA reductase (NADPH)
MRVLQIQTDLLQGYEHLALTTFIFPDSVSSQLAPHADAVVIPSNVSASSLPGTANVLSQFSQDSSLAFYTPYTDIADFLRSVQEIPATNGAHDASDDKRWVMKASRLNGNGHASYSLWLQEGWTSFVDLVKHAETLDIVIMALGYLSMHLTFISLFLSMKRLGSNAWLAVSVLFSSLFAFLFGLATTTRLGVPINMVLLSEGLPFLVVIVGFEKSIILTKAVLSASYDSRRRMDDKAAMNGNAIAPTAALNAPPSIQDAIQLAVKEIGFEIVLDYVIEIAVLCAGAASGIQGGLRQFCFLAAWILFFDCVLLFTFYTTILCLKLEINRIKRHVALRKALEEDGMAKQVAENVANNNDWPTGQPDKTSAFNIFGQKVKANSVPKFKIWMVTGFVLINIVNLCTIPFRTTTSMKTPAAAISSVLTPAPIDPFKVAENGLDSIYVTAKSNHVNTYVTVLPPIKYDLEVPMHSGKDIDDYGFFDYEYTDQFFNVVGGRVIESLLKSLEDPALSKWVLIALTLSVILNGYLFNAARWSLKEPQTPTPSPAVPQIARPVSPVIKRKPVDTTAASDRSREECEQMLKEKKAAHLNDEELIDLSLRGKLPGYAIEKSLEDPTLMSRLESFVRAVKVRRGVVSRTTSTRDTTYSLESSKVPYEHYNYELVHGACCENVIGYLPLPLGVAGPLMIDGQNYFIPMATTEGVLVASTSRGAKAINAGGGAVTVVTGDGMTRGPCVSFPTLARAGQAKVWLDSPAGQKVMTEAFNSTSRFARLQSMKTALAGTYLYIRFKTTTGDAMGMNMISKGCEKALATMSTDGGFDDMHIISLSGNFCTDKKPAAVNWIDGRGKAVVAEAIIPGDVVKSVLKSDVDAMVELNTAKNLIGSAMAGSIGGFNAHASNLVTAVFLATGQDPAQNVESSNCITIMKK